MIYDHRYKHYKDYTIYKSYALGKQVWAIKITDYLETFLKSIACPHRFIIYYEESKPAYILCNLVRDAEYFIDNYLIDHELYLYKGENNDN